LQKSSAFSWSSAGMGFAGVCSTASFSESPNDAAACSLSDILEPHAPPRFFLSPKAAAGILRRAKKRGRELPVHLNQALIALAEHDRREAPLTPLKASSPRSTAEAMPAGSGRSRDRPEKETPVPYSVRRLTPVECEILQGFPSGWTVPGIEL
jgi:site-specific DNA-cytosine methylase